MEGKWELMPQVMLATISPWFSQMHLGIGHQMLFSFLFFLFLSFFFKKFLFYIILTKDRFIERRNWETFICWFSPQMATMSRAAPIWNQEQARSFLWISHFRKWAYTPESSPVAFLSQSRDWKWAAGGLMAPGIHMGSCAGRLKNQPSKPLCCPHQVFLTVTCLVGGYLYLFWNVLSSVGRRSHMDCWVSFPLLICEPSPSYRLLVAAV